MSVDCAHCPVYACRLGRVDIAPTDCVMRGDLPEFESLYSDPSAREMAYHAARVEAEGYCRWTRLRELVELAGRIGARRIGVAYCVDMVRVAARVQRVLEAHGLEAVMPRHLQPWAQASLFALHETDLNVVAGMCVAHEAALVRHSDAPVVCLVARDRRLQHNPVAALCASGSYLHDELYGARRRAARSPPSAEDAGFARQDFDEIALRVLRQSRNRWSRLREAIAVAHQLDARHIGVSFCVGLRDEAAILVKVLEANGFRVSSVCCKSGAIEKERLGILDDEKVRPGHAEMICNPIAQATLLNRAGVDFTLVLGQCVGHDAATLGHLAAPAATLVAKDRVLAHNTVAALITPDYGP